MKERLELDNEQLQRLVEAISLRDFGKPFRHRATFNARLKTTGGRYLLHTHHIEINPRHLQIHGFEELVGIIRHELCHYHLHLEGKGYRHRDRDFRELLKAVGGARFCKPVVSKKGRPYRYALECSVCRHRYLRKKRMDPARYRCGRCGGALQLFSLQG